MYVSFRFTFALVLSILVCLAESCNTWQPSRFSTVLVATPVGTNTPLINITATKNAYPVTGSVLLAGGASATGGIIGETIQVQAAFNSSSSFGNVTHMRVQRGGACALDSNQIDQANWEPFTNTKTFPVTAASNWVGFYVSVQYRDENGNLSPVYCDDLSVEGMPPTQVPAWMPTSNQPIHWHWQLSDDFVYPRDVLPGINVYDLDGELTSAETVAQLHALSPDIKLICYIDVGVYETYRSDASRFSTDLIGRAVEGWEDSYWLDIRQTETLLPILRERMQRWCKDKGFDAVEPDDSEVWSNHSGFPISKAENIFFNQQIANLAHSLGLSVGLKNNTSEAPELWQYFDWALNEQCWEFDECEVLRDSFTANGKAVFNIEYNMNPGCARANAWRINSALRDLHLVSPLHPDYLYYPCVTDEQDTW